MKTKTVGLIIAAFVVSLSFAPAAFACGLGECEPPEDPVDPVDPGTKTKGDNGWGNGADDINAGSGSGKTAASKSSNGYGTGPGPAKFTTR